MSGDVPAGLFTLYSRGRPLHQGSCCRNPDAVASLGRRVLCWNGPPAMPSCAFMILIPFIMLMDISSNSPGNADEERRIKVDDFHMHFTRWNVEGAFLSNYVSAIVVGSCIRYPVVSSSLNVPRPVLNRARLKVLSPRCQRG